MDEWADENGNIAPETYKAGFAHSMLKYLVYEIDEKLRMPLSNVHYPTNKNINSYSDMITDCGEGGADICSSSPGWTGHMAFIDPVSEFMTDSMDGYFPMKDSYDEGGYEARSSSFKAGVAELIIEKGLEILEGLKK